MGKQEITSSDFRFRIVFHRKLERMWLKHNPFISLILNLLRFGVACGSLRDAKALLSDLLANYEKQLPPRLNQSDITTVDLGFSFVSLNEFKEITGRLELTIAVSLVWKEERFI